MHFIQPKPRKPILTYSLLIVMALVHGLSSLTQDASFGLGIPTLLGAQLNALVLERGQWWRPVTAMFLHADWLHLGMNSLALYQLGPLLERAYGTARFLAIWVFSGLAGNWLFLWLGPIDVLTVGASGAIFGLFGALVILGLRLRRQIQSSFWLQIAVTLGLNLYIGLVVPFINHLAHLGGFFAGLVWAGAFVLTRPGLGRHIAQATALAAEVALVAAAYLRV